MADLKPSTPPTTTVLNEKLTPLPYWLVNVPRLEWTTECPSFLRDLPERMTNSLSKLDEQFRPADWARVKEIVRKPGRIFPSS